MSANPVSQINLQVLCRAVSLVRCCLHTVCRSLSPPASARDWWRRVGYIFGAPALIACTDLRQTTSRFSEWEALCERETLHALQCGTQMEKSTACVVAHKASDCSPYQRHASAETELLCALLLSRFSWDLQMSAWVTGCEQPF